MYVRMQTRLYDSSGSWLKVSSSFIKRLLEVFFVYGNIAHWRNIEFSVKRSF